MTNKQFLSLFDGLRVKNGTFAKMYQKPLYWLLRESWKGTYARPVEMVRYRSYRDVTSRYRELLNVLDLSYVEGNNYPQGGKSGFYIRLTDESAYFVERFLDSVYAGKVRELYKYSFE